MSKLRDVLWFLVSLAAILPGVEAQAGCGNDCMDPCVNYDIGPDLWAIIAPDEVTVCVQQNPLGSDQWDAEDWFSYFSAACLVGFNYGDTDVYQLHWWHAEFADTREECQSLCLGSYYSHNYHGCNCSCICRHYIEPWSEIGGGPLVVAWSGTVDLTVPNTYTLSATVCNQIPPTGMFDCVPVDYPTWAEDDCQIVSLTIHVVCPQIVVTPFATWCDGPYGGDFRYCFPCQGSSPSCQSGSVGWSVEEVTRNNVPQPCSAGLIDASIIPFQLDYDGCWVDEISAPYVLTIPCENSRSQVVYAGATEETVCNCSYPNLQLINITPAPAPNTGTVKSQSFGVEQSCVGNIQPIIP